MQMNRREFFKSTFLFVVTAIAYPTISKFRPAQVKKSFTPADIEGLTCWYISKDDMLFVYNRALEKFEIAEVENYMTARMKIK